nr:MAG TPA: hypothetical protein [Caudoviricetes sp.]
MSINFAIYIRVRDVYIYCNDYQPVVLYPV